MSNDTEDPKLVALREAWIDAPFDGAVEVGNSWWLQPLMDAVTAIVDPDRSLREQPDVRRRGQLASYRSKVAWADAQIQACAKRGLDDAEFTAHRAALIAECIGTLGVDPSQEGNKP